MVLPADILRVGALGACILALIRYMTGIPGEANGRRVVDGQMFWRAAAPDIAKALGGGVSPRTVSATVRELVAAGHVTAIPAEDFYGDRAKAYRASDLPSATSDTGSEQPSADIADRSADIAEHVGRKRHTPSAISADLPIPEELKELSGREKARTARGTRLDPHWMPPRDVITAMRTECPGIDLEAEHRRFVDYWTDQTGTKATKVSWVGTWRNWIRRAAESAPRGARPGTSTSDHRVAQVQALKATQPRLELR